MQPAKRRERAAAKAKANNLERMGVPTPPKDPPPPTKDRHAAVVAQLLVTKMLYNDLQLKVAERTTEYAVAWATMRGAIGKAITEMTEAGMEGVALNALRDAYDTCHAPEPWKPVPLPLVYKDDKVTHSYDAEVRTATVAVEAAANDSTPMLEVS